MMSVRSVTKTHRDLMAVDDITFETRPGRVTRLLGLNGTAKSSTMRVLVIRTASGRWQPPATTGGPS